MVADPKSADAIEDELERVTERQRAFERQLETALAVDPAGLGTMAHLLREGDATPTELARRLGISTAAMTLVLDRLQAAGHVSRRPHPSDRRKVLVIPAERSARTAEELVDPLLRGIRAVTEALGADERAAVSRFLADVVAVYDRALSTGRPDR